MSMPVGRKQIVVILALLLSAANVRAFWGSNQELGDLYFGEALFYAFQEDYFAAITRLDIELTQHYELDQPSLDTLTRHRGEAEFDVGDLELAYRMHQRAGRAIQRVLDAENVPQSVRNEAAYRLAKIYYAKSEYVNTVHALDLIRGEVSKSLAQRAALLRGQAQMTQLNFAEAIKLLQPIRDAEEVKGYAPYNLGIAYMLSGQLDKGINQLGQVGQISGGDAETAALRDKANLTLGNRLLEEGQPAMARPYLERVRLEGPLSNRALLWAGWADAALNDYQKALVPWTALHDRDPTDAAVQEALLAVPYAYTQLQAFGRAALLYGEAVNAFDNEIARLDASVASILQGKLRQALVRDPEERSSSFIQSLRSVEDAPETRYLLQLMAGHDFQESVKNYRDMEMLKINVKQWLSNIEAYQDLIVVRQRYYEPLLPDIEREFKTQDSLMQSVLLRRDEVARRRTNAQKARNTMEFATQSELSLKRSLDRIDYRLSRMAPQPGLKKAQARLARLQGVLSWQINNDYDRRLQDSFQHLQELDELIKKLQHKHQTIVILKREAYQSFEGYSVPFQRMSTRLQSLLNGISATMQQQASYLEKVAVRELDRRRIKLAEYRTKARFALAESYDLATKKQAEQAEEAIRKEQQSVKEIQVDEDNTDAQPGSPAESAP